MRLIISPPYLTNKRKESGCQLNSQCTDVTQEVLSIHGVANISHVITYLYYTILK